jgi:hypothetical protein
MIALFLAASLTTINPATSTAPPTENTWTQKTPMPTARSNFGVAVVDGKIYAIGGTNGINEEYDPVTDKWTTKAPMPTGRMNLAVASYGGKIYCIGGDVEGDGNPTAINEVYDPATDSWTTKASMPTARYSPIASVVDGKIYLIGGFPYPDVSCVNEVYDPATDSWSNATSIPRTVAGCVSAVVNDKIYVIDSEATEIYDSSTRSWSQGAPPPLYKEENSYIIWDGAATSGVNAPMRIYAFTRWSVEVYDVNSNSWMVGAKLPTERNLFSVAVVDDLFYVVGGFTQVYDWIHDPQQTWYANNEVYTPFGYGKVSPTINITSPETANYSSSNISLTFTVNKPATWFGYSLDGAENVTIEGNTTFSELALGAHNVTVYARDTFGNVGASQTVTFSVFSPPSAFFETFPILPLAALIAAIIVCVGIVFIFKRKKQQLLAG